MFSAGVTHLMSLQYFLCVLACNFLTIILDSWFFLFYMMFRRTVDNERYKVNNYHFYMFHSIYFILFYFKLMLLLSTFVVN